jgi:hypothetical protein
MREVISGPLWPGPEELQDRKVLVVCGKGDSSRMMVAMLRARGVEAFCVDGELITSVRRGGNGEFD